MGEWALVGNQDRKFGSASTYWHVEGPSGESLLFTENELLIAKKRADANPEDLKDEKGRKLRKAEWF